MHRIAHWHQTIHPPTLPKAGEIHLWRIRLAPPCDHPTDLLTPDEQQRACAILSDQKRKAFICGRSGMRRVLSGYLNCTPAKLSLDEDQNGKPQYQGEEINLQFNLSHSAEMALLGVTQDIPLGIDLEQLKSRPQMQQIAKRMFQQSIAQRLSTLQGDALTRAFFTHWTDLEARAKCTGQGIFGHTDQEGPLITTHFEPQEGWIACLASPLPVTTPDRWRCLELSEKIKS